MNIKFKIILVIGSLPIVIYLWPTSLGGSSEILVVQGQSMYPTILDGSLVITKTAPSYQIDDIVSYSLKEEGIKRIVVHRIINETEEGFAIKGDNNERKDAGFPTQKDIRGKVIFATPYFGEALEFLRNPIMFFISIITTLGIQIVNKKRRKKFEKLRRIRLGLPPESKKLTGQEKDQKAAKPDYSLLFGALSLNTLIFILVQISIVEHLVPIRHMGDSITGFLFQMLAPSLASTVVFGLYTIIIVGLYFLTKYYEAKIFKSKTSSNKKAGYSLQLLGKQINPMLAGAQFIWFLLILLSLLHLLAIGGDVVQSVTNPCDPTKALC